jgi:hypothetical protein
MSHENGQVLNALTGRAALAAMTAAVALAGCASFKVTPDVQQTASFEPYKTFAVAPCPADASHPVSKQLQKDGSAQSSVVAAISQSLSGKGYQPAAADAADLRVCYFGTATDVPDPSIDYWAGPSASGPYQTPMISSDGGNYQGNLTIEATDARAGKVVWRSTAQGSARVTLAQAASQVMKQFPAR